MVFLLKPWAEPRACILECAHRSSSTAVIYLGKKNLWSPSHPVPTTFQNRKGKVSLDIGSTRWSVSLLPPLWDTAWVKWLCSKPSHSSGEHSRWTASLGLLSFHSSEHCWSEPRLLERDRKPHSIKIWNRNDNNKEFGWQKWQMPLT
jgi:hypothetical protein